MGQDVILVGRRGILVQAASAHAAMAVRVAARDLNISRAMAAAYFTTVVGVLSHASWVMASIEGWSMMPIESHVNSA